MDKVKEVIEYFNGAAKLIVKALTTEPGKGERPAMLVLNRQLAIDVISDSLMLTVQKNQFNLPPVLITMPPAEQFNAFLLCSAKIDGDSLTKEGFTKGTDNSYRWRSPSGKGVQLRCILEFGTWLFGTLPIPSVLQPQTIGQVRQLMVKAQEII